MLGAPLGYLETIDVIDLDAADHGRVGGYSKILTIRKHSILKIGRNEKECDVVLDDPAISSVHCIFWAILFDEESMPMCYVKDCSLNGIFLNGLLLKKNKAYLLQHGDVIELCRQSGTFRFSNKAQRVNEKLLQQLDFQEKVNQWQVTPKVIGNGTFGHVLVAYKNNEDENETSKWSPENYAVKIIKLKPNKLDKEARILLRLNHPNIIKVHHTYCDLRDNLYIFQDLIPGGDLFSYLAKGDCLTSVSETESLIIVYQILNALKYLHDQGIVHRDLKLDNILLTSPEPCTRIVLADFGIAKDLTTAKARMHTVVGTPEYCAPEVGFRASRKAYQSFSRAATLEQKGYDSKCDLWSLGVIAHIMLTGISPFYGDGTERSIIQNAKLGKLNFKAKQWNVVAATAKDFVRRLLEVDVVKRLDSRQSLNHPWVAKHRDQLRKIYSKKILSDTNKVDSEVTDLQKKSEWKRKLPKCIVLDQTTNNKKRQKTNI
ncbi:probable Meiosis-specific serine/threonine-protein kinase MEK1 [Zygosaccharomyces bailii]|nr:probable Meiosis-specific serine/threonine-protein kinase MEK1 [Zygosaccharomyces bailii]